MKDIDLQAERAAFEAWYEAYCMPSEADWFRRDVDDESEYHHAITADAWAAWQARAAVEADRAQILPDVEDLKDRLVAISSAVADSDDREAQAIIRTTLELLALTPAPAQQEPSEGCDPHWSYYFKVTECKAKTSRDGDCICWHTDGTGPFDMVRHDDADQFLEWRESPSSAPAPAQQERKPMTPEQVAETVFEVNGNEPSALFWRDLVSAVERHHGIKE